VNAFEKAGDSELRHSPATAEEYLPLNTAASEVIHASSVSVKIDRTDAPEGVLEMHCVRKHVILRAAAEEQRV